MGAVLSTAVLLAVLLWATGGGSSARAAGLSLDLDQWASLSAMWQNGDLNGNNARYPEGGVIPFRLAIEGLKAGRHTLHINYDFTASGHKAYDFLALWNATNWPSLCSLRGGAVSSMCPNLPTPSMKAFPSDPFVANGLSVAGAEAYDFPPRYLTAYGATIVSISRPVHSGSVNGNSSADITVTFQSSGSAVLLAWGGHLAQSAYWDRAAGGPLDGASQVSGAPWHMRTLQLDGSGNRNQDRSIQPSAIVGAILPPAPATPTPRPGAPTPRPGAPTPAPGAPTVTLPPTSASEPGTPTGGPLVPTLAGIALAAATAAALSARRTRRSSGRRGAAR